LLLSEKKDNDDDKIQKLEDFIVLVRSKLCKDWSNAYELGAVVSRSLTQLIKNNPRTGWVRADTIGSEELLVELNEIRKENDQLKEKIKIFSNVEINIPDLAPLNDEFEVLGTCFDQYQFKKTWAIKLTWKELFSLIAPKLLNNPDESSVEIFLRETLFKDKFHGEETKFSLNGQVFQTIKVQLMALNLINVKYSKTIQGGAAFFWYLTPKGESLLYETRTIRKKPQAVPAYKS
jgi:hypothetical protein